MGNFEARRWRRNSLQRLEISGWEFARVSSWISRHQLNLLLRRSALASCATSVRAQCACALDPLQLGTLTEQINSLSLSRNHHATSAAATTTAQIGSIINWMHWCRPKYTTSQFCGILAPISEGKCIFRRTIWCWGRPRLNSFGAAKLIVNAGRISQSAFNECNH